MKVLVTGAAGFIGSHLTARLLSSGLGVRCLVHTRALPEGIAGVEYVQGNLLEPDSLAPAVDRVDVIYHLAGATKARTLADYLRINEHGTRHLLEAAARHTPDLQRFLLVSSLAAAGPSADGHLLSEEEEPKPVSSYGISKLRAEEVVWHYGERLPVTVVRPPAVYGPRERDLFVYFRQVHRGVLLHPTGGDRYLSLIHVEDLVRGLVAAVSSDRSRGRVYYLSNPEPVTWRHLGNLIAESFGVRPWSINVPVWLVDAVSYASEAYARISGRPALLSRDKVREMKQRYWVCDPSRAKQELNFSTGVELEQGIRETAQWYLDNGWL